VEWIKVGAGRAALLGRRGGGIEDRVVRSLVKPFAKVSVVIHFTSLFLGELARIRDNKCLENELAVKSHDKRQSHRGSKEQSYDERKLKGEGVNVLDIRE
jgi:hypothetical protein